MPWIPENCKEDQEGFRKYLLLLPVETVPVCTERERDGKQMKEEKLRGKSQNAEVGRAATATLRQKVQQGGERHCSGPLAQG